MTRTLTLKELRPSLPKVMDRIEGRLDRYFVTRRGKPVAVMMSVEDYESLMETLDVMADPRAVAGIRRGMAEYKAGKTRSLKDIKARLAAL